MEEKKKITVGEIIQENAQLKADISTCIVVFSSAFKALGIKMDDMAGSKDFMQILGKVLPSLMTKMTTGGLDNDAFARLNELTPIIERYKNLAPIATNEHN